MDAALSTNPPAPTFRVVEATHLGDDAFALTLLGSADATAIVSFPRGVLSDRVEVTGWSSDEALDWVVDHADDVWHACWVGVRS